MNYSVLAAENFVLDLCQDKLLAQQAIIQEHYQMLLGAWWFLFVIVSFAAGFSLAYIILSRKAGFSKRI